MKCFRSAIIVASKGSAQALESGHFTQNPCSGHFERNRDFAPTDKRHHPRNENEDLLSRCQGQQTALLCSYIH
jgi:hypothetical protein